MESELAVRNANSYLRTGMNLDLEKPSLLHPQLQRLLSWQQHLQQQMDILEKNQALRPQPSQFPMLLRDVKQFMATVGNSDHLMQLMNKFSDIVAALMGVKKSKLRVEMVVNEGKAVCASLTEFCKKMAEDYPLYRDLMIPYITGLDMVSCGIF